jgi:peptidoglycan/xylan/chitin deacetylase (PgdA/CDA1 family)
MVNSRPPVAKRREPKKKVKWNYKRLAIVLPVLACLSIAVLYGGYTVVSGLFSSNDQVSEKVAKQPGVRVAAKVIKPPATTTTTEVYYEQYAIKSGDTLYGIALKYDVSLDKIRSANNNIAKSNDLKIGTVLKIPVPKPPETETDTATGNPKGVAAKVNIAVTREEIARGPMTSKKIALTFDAGVSSESTSQILDTLKDKGIKATFFLTGKWVEDNPELAKTIASQGNTFGNHTYSHPDLTQEKEADIRYQLSSTEGLIKSATGMSTKPIFRPPYGARDARVLRIAADEGYRSIYWTVDSLDWKTDMKPEQVKNRVLAGLGNGAIVLMHCGSPQTAQILPELIEDIKSRGYTIVDIAGLFE